MCPGKQKSAAPHRILLWIFPCTVMLSALYVRRNGTPACLFERIQASTPHAIEEELQSVQRELAAQIAAWSPQRDSSAHTCPATCVQPHCNKSQLKAAWSCSSGEKPIDCPSDPTDAGKCVLLNAVPNRVARGQEFTITFQARDHSGHNRTNSNDYFVAAFRGTSLGISPIRPLGSGRYTASIVIREPGKHVVSIFLPQSNFNASDYGHTQTCSSESKYSCT